MDEGPVTTVGGKVGVTLGRTTAGHTLDQALWMRPVPELAGYRTPIKGLWLGGNAMHPAVPGLAGYNCARELLRST